MISADEWIHRLCLSPHPEGGYFRQVYKSNEYIKKNYLPHRFEGDRCFSTSIYFLLNSGDFSAFHRIKQDEIWHFYDGCSITIHVIDEDTGYSVVTLGRDVRKNMHLQYCIPKGSYFGAIPDKKNSYSLVGCTVSPGFEFEDFEMPGRKKLISLFPEHAAIIEKLTHPA